MPWWRHQMETFSALLAICAGNSSVTSEFPAQRPVNRGLNLRRTSKSGMLANTLYAQTLRKNGKIYGLNVDRQLPFMTMIMETTRNCMNIVEQSPVICKPAAGLGAASRVEYLWHGSHYGNIFRVTGPLCEEFTGHRWIALTKASDAELWCFLWSEPEQTVE